MDRRESVLQLQAQLEAKRQELAQLQLKLNKAEVCRRSQVSGQCESSQAKEGEVSCEETRPQSVSTVSGSSKSAASQEMLRSLMDPHSPVWLSGQHYPAQYLIRQTRSMSKAKMRPGPVAIPKPPPSDTIPVEDFDLPDNDTFYPLKHQRIEESLLSCCSEINCKLIEDGHPTRKLKCIRHILCATQEVFCSEPASGKLIVKGNDKIVVVFDNRVAVYCHRGSSCHRFSYSLSKALISFDYLSTINGIVIMAVAHLGEIALLALSDGHWTRRSLPTDQLMWPLDFASYSLSMSESSEGAVLIAAHCCDDVCVWSINPESQLHCVLVSMYRIPHFSSLFLLPDLLLATTVDHHLVIYSASDRNDVCPSSIPLSLKRRKVPLSCSDTPHDHREHLPFVLAATKSYNCLLVVLTVKWATGERLLNNHICWIVSVSDNHQAPRLLHTFRCPQTTVNLRPDLCAYAPMDRAWRLVGVANGDQIMVWKGTETIPSVIITLNGEFVSDVAWDPLSNSCLVLDKLHQVHCFQVP